MSETDASTEVEEQSSLDEVTLQSGDLVPDRALEASDVDEFEHRQIADRLGDLVCQVEPKTNIALFGPWGSGKSSIEGLLRKRLETDDETILVRFDAWRYSGGSLKRAFLLNASKDLDEAHSDEPGFPEGIFDRVYSHRTEVRFRWKTVWRGIRRVTGFFAAAVLLSAVSYSGFLAVPGGPASTGFWQDFLDALRTIWLIGSGPVAALLAAVPLFEFGRVTVSRGALSDDDEFVYALQEILGDSPKKRIVFFVDELDRCMPSEVLETLVAIRTFLELDKAVFIVAADREVLVNALETEQANLRAQSSPSRAYEPYYDTAGAFLDKLFQHQVEIPPLRRHALGRLARTLAGRQGGGLWQDVRDAGNLDTVIYALLPAHVQSPRRVKVLMNNFAVNVRIAESRGIADWLDKAAQIAKLTALRTEFPEFARHLVLEPRLVETLTVDESELEQILGRRTQRLSQLTAHYKRVGGGQVVGATADEAAPDPDLVEPDRLQAQHLLAYLRKTAFAEVHGPDRSLLYMEPTGYLDNLSSGVLSDVIESASATPPEDTVAEFESSSDALIAARILSEEYGDHSGPGLLAVVIVVCRLAEMLDDDHLDDLADKAGHATLQRVKYGGSPDTLPGALRLSTSPKYSQGAEMVLAVLQSLAADSDKFGQVDIPRLSRLANRLSKSQQVWFVDILAGREDSDSALLSAVQNLPESTLRAVWPTVAKHLSSTLEALTADAPEHLSSVAAAVQERFPPSSSQYVGLLEDAVVMNPEHLYDTVRDLAVGLPEERDGSASTRLAARAFQHAPTSEWDQWLPLVTERIEDRLRVDAIQRAIRELDITEEDELALLTRVVETYSASPFDDADSVDEVISALSDAAVAEGWSKPEQARSANTQVDELIDSLDPGTRLQDHQRRVLQACAKQDLPGSATIQAHKYLKEVEDATVRLVSEDFDSEFGTDPPHVHALRLRMDVNLRAEEPAIPPEALTKFAHDGDGNPLHRAIIFWMTKTRPGFVEVTSVLDHFTIKPGEIVTYAEHLSLGDRSDLWNYIRENEYPASVQCQVAAQGLPYGTIETYFRAALAGSRQEERNQAAEWVKLLPLSDDYLIEHTMTLVKGLLATGAKGNVRNAADFTIKAGRLTDGNIRDIRGGFRSHWALMTQRQQADLIRLGVVTKPKKQSKGLGRLLDALGL